MKTETRILLAVTAHPDDETFGMGGTLALYASRGVSIHLICATRGEVGEVDAKYLRGFSSIGELREHELRCAANTLGLAKVYFLNYRDSGMPNTSENQHPQALIQAPVEQVAHQVAALIRQIKPQVVLTFDPLGGYQHPDHIAIHKATVRAFDIAGDNSVNLEGTQAFSPSKLYFHTMPRGFLKLAVKIMPLFRLDPRHFGSNKDIDLTVVVEQDFPTHARIDYRSVVDKRNQASACHASQGGDAGSGYIITWLMRLLSPTETYMRAFPPVVGKLNENDFFLGLKV